MGALVLCKGPCRCPLAQIRSRSQLNFHKSLFHDLQSYIVIAHCHVTLGNYSAVQDTSCFDMKAISLLRKNSHFSFSKSIIPKCNCVNRSLLSSFLRSCCFLELWAAQRMLTVGAKDSRSEREGACFTANSSNSFKVY